MMFGLGKSSSTHRPAQADHSPDARTEMPWNRIRMSVNEIAAGTHIQLQVAFEAMFRASKAPRDAAMFGNRFLEDDYTYYFAPGAARFFSVVMSGFGARDCPEPGRESVSLLVGNPDAMTSLIRSDAAAKGK